MGAGVVTGITSAYDLRPGVQVAGFHGTPTFATKVRRSRRRRPVPTRIQGRHAGLDLPSTSFTSDREASAYDPAPDSSNLDSLPTARFSRCMPIPAG